MSDEGPSPRGTKVKKELEIVGKSGVVEEEFNEMRMEDFDEMETKKWWFYLHGRDEEGYGKNE